MSIQIIQGDCRAVLPTLGAGSVQCIVTSPPYFGLRDYGTATWDGGDPECDHIKQRSVSSSTLMNDGRACIGLGVDHKYANVGIPFGHSCGKCSATRVDAQIGLEASPDLFIAEMVAVFREVWRVLRDDGVLFLNLGDSYVGNGGATGGGSDFSRWKGGQTLKDHDPANRRLTGLKPKDLLMMPARVAIALQADGWYLRSDIIWVKPNPMPESVTDRPTTAHEHVFLLTKRAKYFYDADAIAEVSVYPEDDRKARSSVTDKRNSTDGISGVRPGSATYPTRNARSIWTIATHAYPAAHFATFPPELAERCIKAGSKPGDTILDPFSGAGTTALVADRLGRRAIGIELNPQYATLARNRVIDDAPLFAEVS